MNKISSEAAQKIDPEGILPSLAGDLDVTKDEFTRVVLVRNR